jgi:hypothetical protein
MVLASETCLDEELVASIVALSICLAASIDCDVVGMIAHLQDGSRITLSAPYIYPRVVPSITMKQ